MSKWDFIRKIIAKNTQKPQMTKDVYEYLNTMKQNIGTLATEAYKKGDILSYQSYKNEGNAINQYLQELLEESMPQTSGNSIHDIINLRQTAEDYDDFLRSL